MIYEEIVNYYGTAYKAAKENGFSTGTVYKWKEKGFVPIQAQIKIEEATDGKLKASLKHLTKD